MNPELDISLKTKTVHGVLWVGLYYITNLLISLIINLILARLLLPEDFGMVAMAMILINSLLLFQGLGINAALIRWADVSTCVTSTAFYLILGVSLSLAIVGYFITPSIAIFFDNATLMPVIKVLILTIIIGATGVVPATLLDKHLEFRKQIWLSLVPTLVFGFTATLLAWLGAGVWSIVWAKLIQTTLSAILVWFVSSWRPTWEFDVAVAQQLFVYGKDITFTSVLIFIFLTVDNTIVGKLLGEHALGLYTTAFIWGNLSATSIGAIFGRVLFPTFAVLQHDLPRTRKLFLKVLRFISIFTLPIAVGLAVIAEDMVSSLYKPEWIDMVPLIQVLAVYGMLRSLGTILGPLFMACGRQALMLKIVTFQVLLAVILIYPVTMRFGAIGTSLLLTSIMLLTMIIYLIAATIVLKIPRTEYFQFSYPQIVATAIMALLIIILRHQLSGSFIKVVIISLVGAGIYATALFLIGKNHLIDEFHEIYQSLLANKTAPSTQN
jgi:O-antigen/teichoic acid export membrane protein